MPGFDRRRFLAGAAAAAAPGLTGPAMAESLTLVRQQGEWRSHFRGGMLFRWRHEEGALLGEVSAATAGWMAVGFNDAESLKGTCFVMAQLSVPPARVELRRALVPDHIRIEGAAVQEALQVRRRSYATGRSQLDFRLLHAVGDTLGVNLSPGATTYLLMAWSRSPDFAHHSAFRDQRDVVL
ncbi:hypothetical protein [Pelagibius sp.]|uniref:hypothetical protein n=1 Tax=Pelagibius sp. TaxID=1931238 RepID=UPI002608859D|nr:hypothetical protein [Pelagibius sp.]